MMKPLQVTIVLVSLAVGVVLFMPPKPSSAPNARARLLHEQTKLGSWRVKRKKKRRVALRIRKRGRTVRMKQLTYDGPFLFYKPKAKSKQRWRTGTKLRYRIWYKATSALAMSRLPSPKKRGKRRIRSSRHKFDRSTHLITGELHLHVKRGEQGVTHIAAQVTRLSIKQKKRLVLSPKGMGDVFWFQVGTDGRFARFRFSRRMSEKQRRMLKELTRQLEFRLPSLYKGKKWTYQEKDSNGTYTELVQWLKRTQYAKQTIDFFMKKKQRYNRLSKQTFVHKVKLINSLYRIKINTDAYGVEAIDGEESFSFQRKGGITWMKASFKIAYQRIHKMEHSLAVWSAEHGKSTRIPRPRRRVFRRPPASRYASLADAMKAFRSLRNKSKYNAAQALAGYLKSHPSGNQVLADMIKRNSVPKEEHSLLIHSFELAATPAAQTTLVGMMNDKGHTDGNRLRAIVASNSFKSPSKQVIDSLWRLHQKGSLQSATGAERSRASTALLALGALSQVNARVQQLRSQLNQKLIRALQSAKTISQQKTALVAIKNAASDSLASVVKPYLHHTSFLLRKGAVEALIGMSAEPHNAWLAARLQQEAQTAVQATILLVIAHKQRPVASVTFWVKQQISNRNRQLRTAMMHYLGRTQGSAPQHKRLLAAMLKGESNPTMIRSIYKYMMQK